MTVSSVRSGIAARRVRAILAGGAVLGVGAAITLASWNDSEFAKQEFTAGTFVFQGSLDGSAWADHATSATAIALSTPVTNLSPNTDTYLWFALKATGSDATVTPASPAVTDGATPISADLTMSAATVTGATCDEAAFNGGTAVGATMDLADGVATNLCLKVSAGTDLAQGASGTVLWQWDAESTQ